MSVNFIDLSAAALNRRLYLDRLERSPDFLMTDAYLDQFCPHWRRPSAIRRAIRQYDRCENPLTLLPSGIGKLLAPFMPRSLRPWLLSGSHAHAAYETLIGRTLKTCGMSLTMPPSVFLADAEFNRAAKKNICHAAAHEMKMEDLEAFAGRVSPELMALPVAAKTLQDIHAEKPVREDNWQQRLFHGISGYNF